MRTAIVIALLSFGQQSTDAPKMTGQPCTGAELVGTWKLVESGGKPRAPTDRTVLKLLTPTHFFILSADATGTVSYGHGGPYTVSQDTYTESITYGFGPPFEGLLRGMKVPFRCRIEAGSWHTVAEINGQTFDERYMREPADRK